MPLFTARFHASAFAAAALLAVTMSGCVAQTDDGGSDSQTLVKADSGWLLVNFTIDGANNPEQCDQLGASVIGVKVTSADGTPAGDFQRACPSFYSTMELAAGRYSADAVLLDSAGNSRTSAVSLHDIQIVGGSPLEVPIDFATPAALPVYALKGAL